MNDVDFTKIYSFSKLNTFDNCKKQYYFNYLDPEIAPIKKQFLKPRDYLTKGHAVHGAITLFYHLPAEERSFSNLKNLLLEAWFSEKDAFKEPPLGELGGFKDIEHERKTYKECLVLLKKFYELNDLNPNLFLLPSKNIRDSFDDYKDLIKSIETDISISGKFDRIDEMENGGLRIIDFKTSREKQDSFQLEFYKLLAELNFSNKVDMVSFYYLDAKKIVNFDTSKIDSGRIKDKILNKINIIRNTSNFRPQPSRLCNYCDFKEICPVFKNKAL